MDWDTYFLEVAKAVSMKSKDPSCKVGSIIVGPDREIRSTGWNGFARGVNDLPERYNDQQTKYNLVVHAEVNAICNAARCGTPLDDCTMYIWPLPPCNECAKAIIQSGIKEIVFCADWSNEKWKSSWEISRLMFDECGVRYRILEFEEVT